MVKCTDVGKLENIETHLTQQLEEGKYDGVFFIYTITHLKQKNTITKYVNINVPGIQVKKP